MSQQLPDQLTDRRYWEVVHSGSPAPKRSRGWLSEFLAGEGYRGYLFHEVLLAPYLPVRSDWKLVEIGSAPGHTLLGLHYRFGYDPFGVEYTPNGVEINRRAFTEAGLDPAQVIHADFFADEFQQRYREGFDVVFSNGFIEHFTDVKQVVRQHVNLLRPGGRLVIVIPNLRGLNWALTSFFHREVLAVHNLTIMDQSVFEGLFDGMGLRQLSCGYLGIFTCKLQNTAPNSWKRYLLALACRLELPFEVMFRLVFRRWHPRAWWCSPYLVYVGEKLSSPQAG